MPYIDPDKRRLLREGIIKVKDGGSLQYMIAVMINDILGDNYSYKDLESMMGALAGAQMEFYRQVVAPYEDTKIKLNGGVYNDR